MSKRLFVSVDLDGLTENVAAVQDRFAQASGLNFVDPAQAHLTLKFLGDTAEDRIDDIVSELAASVADSGVEPFSATFEGLGVFPSPGYISVVWLGVGAGSDELTRLHEAIEERTTAMGFEAEDHEFTPHVTLTHMQHGGSKKLVEEVVSEQDPSAGTLSVDEIRLTESVLTDDGPVYSTVASMKLS